MNSYLEMLYEEDMEVKTRGTCFLSKLARIPAHLEDLAQNRLSFDHCSRYFFFPFERTTKQFVPLATLYASSAIYLDSINVIKKKKKKKVIYFLLQLFLVKYFDFHMRIGHLLEAIARTLREDGSKNSDIAFHIIYIFYSFSHFHEFHDIIAHYKLGFMSLSMIDLELKRFEKRQASLDQRKQNCMSQILYLAFIEDLFFPFST